MPRLTLIFLIVITFLAGQDPLPYLEAMAAMASPAGLLPEQVWDGDPIPQHGLEPGKPSGSAMPLVWAHSEFIKLCYSRALGHPVDRPAATWKRYQGRRPEIAYAVWGPRYRPRHVRAGNRLIVALRAPARVHWGRNGWRDARDIETRDTGLGAYAAELPVTGLGAGETVQFTFFWLDRGSWEGVDYEVKLID